MYYSFRHIWSNLEKFWQDYGCSIIPGYDIPMGAGTFHPMSVLGPILYDKWNFACLQPCRRPADSMAGKSPNRFAKFHQYQVILKPANLNVKEVFEHSISSFIDKNKHHILFLESSWESPTLGAYGLGWEVRCDGMEICQITFFNQIAGFTIKEPTIEFAYGIERLMVKANRGEGFYQIPYDDNNPMGIFLPNERDFSKFYASEKDFFHEQDLEKEIILGKKHLESGLPYVAYDNAILATHIFNCLDALKLLDITKKRHYTLSLQRLFKGCCQEIKNIHS